MLWSINFLRDLNFRLKGGGNEVNVRVGEIRITKLEINYMIRIIYHSLLQNLKKFTSG